MTEESQLTRRERRLLYLAAIGAVVLLQFAITAGFLVWSLFSWGGPWGGERVVVDDVWSCDELVREDPGWVLCGDDTGTFRRGTPRPATPRATSGP